MGKGQIMQALFTNCCNNMGRDGSRWAMEMATNLLRSGYTVKKIIKMVIAIRVTGHNCHLLNAHFMPRPMLCILNILSFFLTTLNGKYCDSQFAIKETETQKQVSDLNHLGRTPGFGYVIR